MKKNISFGASLLIVYSVLTSTFQRAHALVDIPPIHEHGKASATTAVAPYFANIEEDTLKNTDYRRVVFTNRLQIAYMSLLPREEIGMEVHPTKDQFFRIEGGTGKIVMGRSEPVVLQVGDGDAAVVPAGTYHNVINTSPTACLKLYVIYAPPEHPAGTRNPTKPRDEHAAHSPTKTNGEKSLYERLGGIFAIAAVVDDFSERVLRNPLVGVNSPNPQLRQWATDQLKGRLPGLKWMRTLWVAEVSGGPYTFVKSEDPQPDADASVRLDLTKPHCGIKITSKEFDAVAGELAKTLLQFNVPAHERQEVLGAFAAHKAEVISCSKN